MTLYCTGGHLTPALAVIDELRKKHPKVVIRFFGREYSQTTTGQKSKERQEIEARNIDFIPINAPKFHRTYFWHNAAEIKKIPYAVWTAVREFRRRKPDVVLSFGGYVALPVCLVAKFFGARIITHEQTQVAGLANQLIALFADVVALSHASSARYFLTKKIVVTGNPIRQALLREYKTPPVWLPKASRKPLLYVTGGSQGSAVINQTIVTLLEKLTRDFCVVHQCGPSKDSHVLHDLEREREKLPQEVRDRSIIREWIEERDVSFLLRTAKVVICRSGANTVHELLLSGTPAIFIPLPFAYNDEQKKNAQAIVDGGGSLMIEQKDLLPDTLYSAITQMMVHYEQYYEQMQELSANTTRTGTAKLLQCILEQ